MRRRSRYGWLELIEGILLILLGIYTLCNPGGMLRGITFAYGFLAVITGISDIVFYAKTERYIGFGRYHCSGDWNFKSPCRTNASDVPKCRRADHDPASPNLVHRSFCFQIDPHPSGPSGRKILLLLYLDCKYPWNHPWLSDDHLAVGSVVFNGLYYWRLSDPSWNRLRGDGLQ